MDKNLSLLHALNQVNTESTLCECAQESQKNTLLATNNVDIIMGLCYRLPSEAIDTDKLFFKELSDSSKS